MIEVVVDFYEDDSDMAKSEGYFRILDKYDALGIGNDKSRNSSIFIDNSRLSELKNELHNLEIKVIKVLND